MFWDDIVLVTEQIAKYGLRQPFVDLGGLEQPCIADYELTTRTGDQNARYVQLTQRPFDHLDPHYVAINPDTGGPFIEDLPTQFRNTFGTAVCLNVLEHVRNPFEVLASLYQVMREDSLLVIETVFSFPYHPSPFDFWRFSPDCLRFLSENAGFTVLEGGWRLTVPPSAGIINATDQEVVDIRSVYVTLAKGELVPVPQRHYPLPHRFSSNPMANRLIQG